MPDLNERRADIPLLCRTLLHRLTKPMPSVRPFFAGAGVGEPQLEPALVERLLRHSYTLHTRELEGLLALSARTSEDDVLELTPDVERELGASSVQGSAATEPSGERQRILDALGRAGGNVSRAASALGLSRQALYRLLKKHGIDGS